MVTAFTFMMTFEKKMKQEKMWTLPQRKPNQQPNVKAPAPEASPSRSEEEILECVGSLHGRVLCLQEEEVSFNTPDASHSEGQHTGWLGALFRVLECGYVTGGAGSPTST